MDAATGLREALLHKLRSRTWLAGQRLPTERALSDAHGLSRSTVRRVLQDLKRHRLITQTVGSGTYVSAQVGDALLGLAPAGSMRSASPAELMAARLALEPAVIDLVIGNATEADYVRMDLCNQRAEAARTLEQFEQWDAALHEAIAEAAHNSVIVGMHRLINEVRAQSEWGAMKRRSATPERRLEYQAEHRALVLALRDRDGDAARRLCLAHLIHVRTNLLGN